MSSNQSHAPAYAETFQFTPLRKLNQHLMQNGKIKEWRARLSLQPLMEATTAQTGLSDFGDKSFMHPLSLLLEDIRENEDIHAVGAFLARRFLMMQLESRLRMQTSLKEEPDILRQPIERPIIILGLPRTGTTRLMHILSEDPAHRPLRTWEATSPAPPPKKGRIGFDRRKLLALMSGTSYKVLAPEIKKMHATGINLPEECILLFATSFDTHVSRHV